MSVFRKLNTLETHRLIKRTYGCQGNKDGGRDRYGIWDGHAHTAICELDDQQGPSVEHRELCSALHGSLDGREAAGSRYTCKYGWGPLLFTWNSHNVILTGYTPTLNKKFKRKEIKYSWLCYCHKHHPVSTTLVHSEHVRQGLNSQSDGSVVSSSPPCGVENPAHHSGSCRSGSWVSQSQRAPSQSLQPASNDPSGKSMVSAKHQVLSQQVNVDTFMFSNISSNWHKEEKKHSKAFI